MRWVLVAGFLALTGCLRPIEWSEIEDRYWNLSFSKVVHFIALGDAGTGSDEQYLVGATMAKLCEERPCDFVLTLGNNIYPEGMGSHEFSLVQDRFEAPYYELGDMPFWITMGHRDWKNLLEGAQAAVDYTLESERWLLPDTHYKIPLLPSWLHIYVLDTSRLNFWFGSKYLKTVEKEMCDKPGWKILAGHSPLHSSYPKLSVNNSVRRKVGKLIQKCDVWGYFSASFRLQEHVETPEYHHFVQGAGGAETKGVQPVGGTQKFVSSEYGFAYVTAQQDKMLVEFFDLHGAKIYEFLEYQQ